MRADLPLDRVEGALLGCALGDALGLPCEGLAPRTLARRFPLDRFGLLGRTGFVSDDTEQTALVAEALAVGATPGEVERHFCARLRWWFARLPFGIGLATLRACVKLWLGLARSGVDSAGNGAAMRAGIVGVVVGDAALRRELVERLARVTHAHALGVEGAVYVAEVAARLARGATPAEAVQGALGVVQQAALRNAVEHAVRLARTDDPANRLATGSGRAEGGPTPATSAAERKDSADGLSAPATLATRSPTMPAAGLASPDELGPSALALATVGSALGTTGFVVHSVGACTWSLLTAHDAMDAVRRAIRLGGDTDTHAAIVGGWAGASWGASALDSALVGALHDGPFGPSHLRGLARALVEGTPPPAWSGAVAMARNLALYPVVLAHGFRRLVPPG